MATDYTMYAGDSKSLVIAITDNDGAAVNVSTATAISYGIYTLGGSAIAIKTLGTGISVNVSTVTVSLGTADTDGLEGVYHHELEITDASGNVMTAVQGYLTIKRGYIT